MCFLFLLNFIKFYLFHAFILRYLFCLCFCLLLFYLFIYSIRGQLVCETNVDYSRLTHSKYELVHKKTFSNGVRFRLIRRLSRWHRWLFYAFAMGVKRSSQRKPICTTWSAQLILLTCLRRRSKPIRISDRPEYKPLGLSDSYTGLTLFINHVAIETKEGDA